MCVLYCVTSNELCHFYFLLVLLSNIPCEYNIAPILFTPQGKFPKFVHTGIFPVFAFYICISSLWTSSGCFGFLFACMMDSDNFSSASPAGKVRTCHCGKRMSSLTDFRTVCIDCRGVDCNFDHRCMECTDTDDFTMTEYVRHKLTLRRKLMSKHKLIG